MGKLDGFQNGRNEQITLFSLEKATVVMCCSYRQIVFLQKNFECVLIFTWSTMQHTKRRVFTLGQ